MRRMLLLVLAALALASGGCSARHMAMHRYTIEKNMEREVHPSLDEFLVW